MMNDLHLELLLLLLLFLLELVSRGGRLVESFLQFAVDVGQVLDVDW